MATTVGTLNGKPLLRASVIVPKTGIWWADVQVSAPTDATLSGDAALVLAGQSFSGTILEDGAPYEGRAWYRVVGGKAKWRTIIAARSYRAAGGLKLSNVVRDAARECGETVNFDPSVFTDRKIGTYYTRREAEAARVLDMVARDAWYVDVDGLTYIGARPSSVWDGKYVLLDKNPAAKRITIAAQEIVGLMPGATLENIEAAWIRHELGDEGLRTHVWGAKKISMKAGVLAAFERLVRRITAELFYTRAFQYKVKSQVDGYLDLDPVRESDGMPALRNVAMLVGIPGGRGRPAIGSHCWVVFTNGDPTMPHVVSYDGQTAAGWKPTHLGLEASTQADVFAPSVQLGAANGPSCARVGDHVHGGFMLFNAGGQLITGSSAPGVNGYYPPTRDGYSSAQSDQSSNVGSVIVMFGPAISVDPASGGFPVITEGSGKVKVAD